MQVLTDLIEDSVILGINPKILLPSLKQQEKKENKTAKLDLATRRKPGEIRSISLLLI